MIVRMSKVEIVGPKALLQDVLSLLQGLGILQIERNTMGFLEKGAAAHIRSFLPDEKSLAERLFLDNLRIKLDELFSHIPKMPVRKSYLEPPAILDTIASTLEKHLETCRNLHEKKASVQKELSELSRYTLFLNTIDALMHGVRESPGLDFIGLTIKDPEAVGHLRDVLSRLTKDKFELLTATAEDGTLVGLIAMERAASETVRKALSDEHFPELGFPQSFGALSFTEKITYLKKKIAELTSLIEAVDKEMENLCRRWSPIYKSVQEWIQERLSVLGATASVFETRMCFCIHGWMSSEDVGKLRGQLAASFGMQVVIEEGEIREEDLEQVPVVLKNPPYFKPFELMTRLLPLPRYTSLDPTPFIAIFFPVFFGMILGDAGYGAVLLLIALIVRGRFAKKRDAADAIKILFISSAYSIFFGILYGEFFGDLGHRIFGLEPLCVERRTAVVPMLAFSLAVGVVHTALGLALGIFTAFKKRTAKEALFKLITLCFIITLIVLFASFFEPFPWIIGRPTIIVILALTPLLLFTGGLLAPLELLKSIGNIISYARIMAIGLTSVLLAFVANRLAGLTGDIVVGVIVGGLLHALNILLGVFAPTIHALRLHYVEFFSKFLEAGGKRFRPLEKPK
jgi:V/A-type H+-transporting ATPase subunit I